MPRASLLAFAALLSAACGFHQPVPVSREHDARFGRLGGEGAVPSKSTLCDEWRSTVSRDRWATSHASFPETNVQNACFSPVRHVGRGVEVGEPPRGSAYPNAGTRARLLALAAELEQLAAQGGSSPHRLFPCSLTPPRLVAAARHNARVLRSLASHTEAHAYAAVVLPGHGLAENDGTALESFLPGEECRLLPEADLARLGAMPVRSARGADALRGEVAPVVITSGGAVHSHVVEAFALMHLLQCRERIPSERILVEPCADHTHTNLRNSGRWLDAMGGRAAYLLTDDGIQSEYFQDVTGFELILGSIDQRSLRDWGYVLGSWRQASVGMNAGFWFTPYRFWAEPRDALGGVTCVDQP